MKTFWICGSHSVNESIKNSKRKIYEVVCKENSLTEQLCNKYKIKYRYYKKRDENKLLGNNAQIAHQCTFAKIDPLPTFELKNICLAKESNLLALENITDVRNIGSIVRTAVCFNIRAIIIEKKNFKSNSVEIYKSASGALEHIDICLVSNLNQALNELKKLNYFIYGLDSNYGEEFNETNISTYGNIFVLGAEGKGLKELTKKNCDFYIKINIANKIGSLNVSNACSAALAIFNYISDKKKAR